jgi:hypothetical protein
MTRSWLKGLMIVFLSGAILGLLGAPGIAFLGAPVWVTPCSPTRWHAVTVLDALPANGTPVRFPAPVADPSGWPAHPEQVRRHIFLRRVAGPWQVLALRADHHGRFRIPVTFDVQARVFRSVCWDVEFALDGKELPARGIGDELESLPVCVDNGLVFVRYELE